MALDRPQDLNSLGFAKPPAKTRVVVAMSGGVDSSVVAAMLAEEGYDVVGVTLQLYDHGAALAKKGACCAGRDIHDARRVAEAMGFPHYVLDYENIFKDAVIDEFQGSAAQPGAGDIGDGIRGAAVDLHIGDQLLAMFGCFGILNADELAAEHGHAHPDRLTRAQVSMGGGGFFKQCFKILHLQRDRFGLHCGICYY